MRHPFHTANRFLVCNTSKIVLYYLGLNSLFLAADDYFARSMKLGVANKCV